MRGRSREESVLGRSERCHEAGSCPHNSRRGAAGGIANDDAEMRLGEDYKYYAYYATGQWLAPHVTTSLGFTEKENSRDGA